MTYGNQSTYGKYCVHDHAHVALLCKLTHDAASLSYTVLWSYGLLCYAVLPYAVHVLCTKGFVKVVVKARAHLVPIIIFAVNDLDPLGLAVEQHNLVWYIQQLRFCVSALWRNQRRGDSDGLSIVP